MKNDVAFFASTSLIEWLSVFIVFSSSFLFYHISPPTSSLSILSQFTWICRIKIGKVFDEKIKCLG